MLNLTKEQVIDKMKSCPQTDNQSVYEHGISVREYTFDLLNHLKHNTPLVFEWKLPDWLIENKDYILSTLVSEDRLILYTELHDIGKPFCLEIDDQGKRHYPNHAEVSYQVFKQLYNDDVVADLIRKDMDFHLLKSEDKKAFANYEYATTLLLVSLAELHSNAALFSGIESISFKIKWKHTNKTGKQILELMKCKK